MAHGVRVLEKWHFVGEEVGGSGKQGGRGPRGMGKMNDRAGSIGVAAYSVVSH